ncbi:putative GTP pyrophosphokinase [Gracilibacillus halotolerans]|uniref:Putative GTP pyrophosphokinase n=1 Tax=Gracilibacillus halotolerans TaxID=74386 RepID=A0A841RDQ5_9BACI|nr:GTP pyrophosphokinase family protein [Gracilibacillus halotolerans]MBB6512120.1 putative GTP pyrophosphokinase [Gracilibacillus halotolerans]
MIEPVRENLVMFKKMRDELTRFSVVYKFALDEMNTKINILKEEFKYIHDYSPIEHVSSRLKTPESILNKLQRKNLDMSLKTIKKNIQDIAGIRITCAFASDIYTISEMISRQKDVEVLEIKDYVKNPKPNGYRSLHLIVTVPVFLSDREEKVPVELQIRTIAMDFWASLEHKIYYKYDKTIPERLSKELMEAAQSAAALDEKMENIHNEIKVIKEFSSLDSSDENVLLNQYKDNKSAITAFLTHFDTEN